MRGAGLGQLEQLVFDPGAAVLGGEQVERGEAVVVGFGVLGELFEAGGVERLEDVGVVEVGRAGGLVGVEVGEQLGALPVESSEVVVVGGHVGDGRRTGVLLASFG